MARPKGSKNRVNREPKSLDGPAPGIGHNDLTPEQKVALLLPRLGEIERLTAEKDAVVAKIRTVRKSLKADGFPPEQVNYALYLRKVDPDKASAEMRMQIETARWLAHPIGHQSDFFGDGVDRTPSVEKARAQGKAAGMSGKSCVVPDGFSPESEQGQEWIKGWHEGQAAIMQDFKPIAANDEADGVGGDAAQRTAIE